MTKNIQQQKNQANIAIFGPKSISIQHFPYTFISKEVYMGRSANLMRLYCKDIETQVATDY